MLEIALINGDIAVRGEIDLGLLGVYRNVEVSDSLAGIKGWDVAVGILDEDSSAREVVDFLNSYYQDYLAKISSNIKSIGDNFLLKVFLDMEACEFEFWNIEKLTVPGCSCENVYSHGAIMAELDKKYSQAPNDGSVYKPDIEKILRSNYPQFNFDSFFSSIVPEICCLTGEGLTFQCSDNFGNEVLCSAYDRLDKHLCFIDWHNF